MCFQRFLFWSSAHYLQLYVNTFLGITDFSTAESCLFVWWSVTGAGLVQGLRCSANTLHKTKWCQHRVFLVLQNTQTRTRSPDVHPPTHENHLHLNNWHFNCIQPRHINWHFWLQFLLFNTSKTILNSVNKQYTGLHFNYQNCTSASTEILIWIIFISAVAAPYRDQSRN